MEKKKIPMLILCVLIALAFWIIPTPIGLEENSWHFLGLFIAVIMAVIFQVMAFVAVCMVTICIFGLRGKNTTPKSVCCSKNKNL